tara:strand:+ start:477 stop:722 length:246 start_codon:yes stop_codon:yes gene_type:complete
MKLSGKDCLHCLTCVVFAVILNLVVPHLVKMLVKHPNEHDVFGRLALHFGNHAEHPVTSSIVLALMVFFGCCLGKMFPLFQ